MQIHFLDNIRYLDHWIYAFLILKMYLPSIPENISEIHILNDMCYIRLKIIKSIMIYKYRKIQEYTEKFNVPMIYQIMFCKTMGDVWWQMTNRLEFIKSSGLTCPEAHRLEMSNRWVGAEMIKHWDYIYCGLMNNCFWLDSHTQCQQMANFYMYYV